MKILNLNAREIKMNTAQGHSLVLTSRTKRIASFLIDHFIITFFLVSIVFIYVGPNFIDENNLDKMGSTMLAVLLPGFLLYFLKESIKGISFGKWIMGIMVRDADDPSKIPSFGRLLVRNLFIVIWPIEFLVLASSREKKRLGDKIVNTTVVDSPQRPSKLPIILSFVGIGIVFFAFVLLFVGTAMKNSAPYKVAIQEIVKNDKILSETGGIKGYGMMPTGSVSISNGHGEAQLQIKVLGNEKDVNVNVYLTKEPDGKWEIIDIN